MGSEFRQEQVRLSSMVWQSELADLAAELLAAASRGDDEDAVLTPRSFERRYHEARQALFERMLREAGLDLCRGCTKLAPAESVQLVLVHECKVANWEAMGSSGQSQVSCQRFGWLCADCRRPVEPREESMEVITGGPAETVEVFRHVYPAVKTGGFLWAKVDEDWVHGLPQFAGAPAAEEAEPAACTPVIADELGLPPRLLCRSRGGSYEVAIDLGVDSAALLDYAALEDLAA